MSRERLFREYAQNKGKEAKTFVDIIFDWGEYVLITLGNSGQTERTSLNYKEMVDWIIKTKKL